MWHAKEPSLLNVHECRAEVKINSPSPVMVTSPWVWVENFRVGRKNAKQPKQTIYFSNRCTCCIHKPKKYHIFYISVYALAILITWKGYSFYVLNSFLSSIQCMSQTFIIYIWESIASEMMYDNVKFIITDDTIKFFIKGCCHLWLSKIVLTCSGLLSCRSLSLRL